MTPSTGWPAPAKLNLFLRILARRADGYHELQTAFQLIDLSDELAFAPRHDGCLRRLAGADAVPAEDDLAVRAAGLLRREVGREDLGADIRIVKRIPLGAGLGGGSSDAATTLVALDRLWGLDLGCERLAAIGLTLGADVPLFVHGVNAWGEGVGERLTPLNLAAHWYAIVHPGAGMSTREAFQAPELTRNSTPITMRSFLTQQGLGAAFGNDLQPVVVARHAGVRDALAWLGARAPARMTGSGACVFAALDSAAQAQATLAGLPGGWSGFVARGLDCSPLAARRARES